jgi:hypothetical protein
LAGEPQPRWREQVLRPCCGNFGAFSDPDLYVRTGGNGHVHAHRNAYLHSDKSAHGHTHCSADSDALIHGDRRFHFHSGGHAHDDSRVATTFLTKPYVRG